jgi:dephospho-CoA kinase
MFEPQRHPVIAAAYAFADERTPKITDLSLYDKDWLINRDQFLIYAGAGVFQLLKEMENHPEANVTYDLHEMYSLMLLINQGISGLISNLSHALVGAGMATVPEMQYCLAKAQLQMERSEQAEGELPKVPMIGVVGAISSGKGTIGEIIQERYQGIHLPLSDRLREVSIGLDGDLTFGRGKLRELNDILKPAYGKDVFVRWTMAMAQRQAQRQKYPVVSLDGFRSLEEAQKFKDEGGFLIGVRATRKTRFQRLVERGRLGDDGWKEFLKSDRIESAWIRPIFEICDVVIDNNGDREKLDQRMEKVLKKVGDLKPLEINR